MSSSSWIFRSKPKRQWRERFLKEQEAFLAQSVVNGSQPMRGSPFTKSTSTPRHIPTSVTNVLMARPLGYSSRGIWPSTQKTMVWKAYKMFWELKITNFDISVTVKPPEHRFCCEVCGAGFDFQSRLKEHMLLAHKTELIVLAECQSCLVGFDSKEAYLTHVLESPENVRHSGLLNGNHLQIMLLCLSAWKKEPFPGKVSALR